MTGTLRRVVWAMAPLGPLAAVGVLVPLVEPTPRAGFALGYLAVVGATMLRLARLPALRSVPLAAIAGLAAAYALGRRGEPELAGLVASIAVLWIGGWLGAAIGRVVSDVGHLAAVAFVAAAADLWSVGSAAGPSHALVTTVDPALLRLAALSAPVVATSGPAAMLGAGDVVFAALYLAAARRHGLSVGRTFAAIAVGLLAAGAGALLLARPVPALPLLGLLVIAVHWRAIRVRKADRPATWVAAALCVGALGWWMP